MAGKHADGRWKSSRRWPSRPASTDRHAPAAVSRREPPDAYYREPDAIERVCAFCVLEYRDSRWQHDRACILAAR